VQKVFSLTNLQAGIVFFLVIAVTMITAFLVIRGLVKKFKDLVCPALYKVLFINFLVSMAVRFLFSLVLSQNISHKA
jgi:hypothetical protein